MLQLIYGGAGCGKTTYARELACQLARDGAKPIMIVPEQFSFESERSMLSLLGAADAQKVSIYSFTRLAEKVSRFTTTAAGRRLDDCGRVAAMGLALNSLAGQLDFYGGRQPSSNFVEHLLDAVKEFKLCAITPKMLADAAPHASGTLRSKLSELSLVFGAYEAIVAQTSLDPMDDLTRLWEQLGQHRFFEGTTVIIDSFRSFTGQELHIISRILEQADRCVITICAENTGDGTTDGLFATSLKTADTLKGLAAKQGVSIQPAVVLGERHRFVSPAIAAVESGIFRYGGSIEQYTEPTDDVTIFEAESRYGEMEFCARECRRLLREEGLRCRDIAIIARKEDAYCDIAFDALSQQDIPCFLDRRTDAASCALMQFVLSALDVVCRGWQCDDLLRCLKTGLVSGIDPSDISELENHCFIWDIKGRDWRREFTQNPDGFGRQMTEKGQALLERINAVRQRTTELFESFTERLSEGTGQAMSAAIFLLLEEAGVPQSLGELCQRLDPAAADEQSQLWDALMSILDQSASIFGQSRLSRDSFAAYIALMINRCDIGHIPQGLDDVTFGSADRIRVCAPKAVFIVGAVDGEFPAAPASAGVFTDEERKCLLRELQLPVAEAFEYNLLDERLMAYNALSAGSHRLYITYPKGTDSSGNRLFASECISEVLKCVPKAARLQEKHTFDTNDIEAPAAAFELAARYWNSGDAAATLAQELSLSDEYSSKLQSVRAAANRTLPRLASRESAAKLFGGRMRISSSQAETFHRCRFSYFCKYGLFLKPRRRARLDNLQFGTVTHYVLEHIFSELGNAPFSRLTDDPSGVDEKVAALLERCLEEEMGGAEGKSAALLYQLRQMRYSLTALVLNMANELSCSDFRPVAFELEISPYGDIRPSSIPLENGQKAGIIGAVDRVDCWEHEGRRYIRVIDYKTGSKKFTLSDVLEGLNMQMLIYLGEICRRDNGRFENAVPAGILYCPAYSGAVSASRDASDYELDALVTSGLRRNGLIIDDSEDVFVCEAMENGLGGNYIPVTKTKKGEISATSLKHLTTPTGYEIIGRFVRWKLRQMCGELSSGSISPDPVKDGFSPCTYCDYYAICRYDGDLRTKYKGGNEAALMQMAAQMKEGSDNE